MSPFHSVIPFSTYTYATLQKSPVFPSNGYPLSIIPVPIDTSGTLEARILGLQRQTPSTHFPVDTPFIALLPATSSAGAALYGTTTACAAVGVRPAYGGYVRSSCFWRSYRSCADREVCSCWRNLGRATVPQVRTLFSRAIKVIHSIPF